MSRLARIVVQERLELRIIQRPEIEPQGKGAIDEVTESTGESSRDKVTYRPSARLTI